MTFATAVLQLADINFLSSFTPGSRPWVIFVILYWAGTVLTHLFAAYWLYGAASQLRRDNGKGPALFPPIVWAMLALLGTMTTIGVVGLLFVALHYSSWCEPFFDELNLAPANGMSGVHDEKVRALRAEIAEL